MHLNRNDNERILQVRVKPRDEFKGIDILRKKSPVSSSLGGLTGNVHRFLTSASNAFGHYRIDYL